MAPVEIPEIRYARNGDVALAYQVFGEGPIDLVFLPAFINNVEIAWESPQYARFLRRLSSFSRVIFMDRRGTGLSDRMSPADLPPLEVLMDDLSVVLDAVGSDHPALFGYSDAGCLCAMFAATYPDRVGALALYAVAAAGVAKDDFPWQWATDEWDSYFRELSSGWGTRGYADNVVPWFQPSLADDERHRAWWARFMRQAASPNSVEAIERIWHQIDVRPILPTIRVPTLVLHRTDDQIEVVEAGRDFAERIPGARFLELPGGDDAPWAGDQDRVLDEVEQFLTGKRHAPDVERVRTELDRFRGVEVNNAGDGFLATFDGPARAVRCAQGIAEAVRDLGIATRAGAHTGEIELDSNDVRGIAVHIGARIGALAGPSEVLVSSTLKDLVAGSGLTFEDAGEHELKGVPDRWRLYRVVPEEPDQARV
jgi:pimeloyl-ACP methyl ester carboxylesterase